MDGIKKLADKLHKYTQGPKREKIPRTVSVDNRSYALLFSYCKRKGLNVGDVISDLMEILIEELVHNGELNIEDQSRADNIEKNREEKQDSKNKFKVVS